MSIDAIGKLIDLLPDRLSSVLYTLEPRRRFELDELRIRAGKPLQFISSLGSYSADARGLTTLESSALLVSQSECDAFLEALTQHSAYAFETELERCCIALEGGIRVGMSGCAVKSEGGERLLRASSFCVRFPHDARGCAKAVLPYIRSGRGVKSALLLSPPGYGKTTLLRELTRELSSEKTNCCVIDDRGELSGGTAAFDLGPRTDVFEGFCKSAAIERAVRLMTPELIVTDELASLNDAEAVIQAVGTGVSAIATAHAECVRDLGTRPVLSKLAESGIFDSYIFLSERRGRLKAVYDRKLTLTGGDMYQNAVFNVNCGTVRAAGL